MIILSILSYVPENLLASKILSGLVFLIACAYSFYTKDKNLKEQFLIIYRKNLQDETQF